MTLQQRLDAFRAASMAVQAKRLSVSAPFMGASVLIRKDRNMSRLAMVIKFALLGGLVTLSGCASVRQREAADTGRLLTAAGFQQRLADSPERLAHLRTMPPLKLVARDKDGEVAYTFADPESCRCLYVGGAEEYAKYQRLARQQEVIREVGSESRPFGPWGSW
jgi:uncharacterized protein YceK